MKFGAMVTRESITAVVEIFYLQLNSLGTDIQLHFLGVIDTFLKLSVDKFQIYRVRLVIGKYFCSLGFFVCINSLASALSVSRSVSFRMLACCVR
jgi:hypothetical protein